MKINNMAKSGGENSNPVFQNVYLNILIYLKCKCKMKSLKCNKIEIKSTVAGRIERPAKVSKRKHPLE